MLAKLVSTLDVLSQGRAWLGLGAGWNEDEATGIGLEFPPLGERFERLEETLQICLQMWSEDDGPYEGKHYRLRRTLNAPQPLQEPRPRILIGGGGERKTLRLVAQYADACNLFAGGEIERKLGILRGHCEDVGRDYDEIEKTAMGRLDPSDLDGVKAELRRLAALGVEEMHGMVPDASGLENLRILGREIIPFAAELEAARTA